MNIADLLRSSLFCSTENGLSMMHPGLPAGWAGLVGIAVALLSIRVLATAHAPIVNFRFRWVPGNRWDLILRSVSALSPLLLQILKFALVVIFLLIVVAGLFGTPICFKYSSSP